MKHSFQHNRPGFTLIELLIAIGIIGVISTLVIVAINPEKQVTDALDARRKVTSNQIGKAMDQYLISTYRSPDDTIPFGLNSAKSICRKGVHDSSCINLDVLVPEYLGELPIDPAETNAAITGYAVYKDQLGRFHSSAQHVGAIPTPLVVEEVIIDVVDVSSVSSLDSDPADPDAVPN